MKKNSKSEIEKTLAPNCEFHASKTLKEKILQAAEQENVSEKTVKLWSWKTVLTTCAATAAIIAIVMVIKPGLTPLYAEEGIFARAAKFFNNVSGYTVTFDARTLPNDNFSYINASKPFVEHKMMVCSDGRWQLDKGERVAEFDGENVYVWLPEEEWGWKMDASDGPGTLEQYELLRHIGDMMQWLEDYAQNHHDFTCRKSETDSEIRLTIKAPAQGDFKNDYAKNSSIMETDTRQTYTFSKADGRLLSFNIDALILGIPRTILKMKEINYNATFSEADFILPSEIEWIDETDAYIAEMANTLPVGQFVGITPEKAAEKMFEALKNWDESSLKVVMRGYPLSKMAAKYKGCTLIEHGEAFKSGLYDGVFVPCTVKLANGSTQKMKIAFRIDKEFGAWCADGGI